MLEDGTPLFRQIADLIASDILDGTLAEGSRSPSTNEFAAFHRINPATAAKGVNLLVEEGILEKRRGLGMFVTQGARERLRAKGRRSFADEHVRPMLAQARKLGFDLDTVIRLVRDGEELP